MKKFGLVVIGLILIGIVGLWLSSSPFKVKDPTDNRFDPNQFSFNDYVTYESLDNTLTHLLKENTSKSDVDHLLINVGNAKSNERLDKERILVSYRKETLINKVLCPIRVTGNVGWQVKVSFSTNKKVTGYQIQPACF